MSIVQSMNCKYETEREGGRAGRMGGWMAECVRGGWLDKTGTSGMAVHVVTQNFVFGQCMM